MGVAGLYYNGETASLTGVGVTAGVNLEAVRDATLIVTGINGDTVAVEVTHDGTEWAPVASAVVDQQVVPLPACKAVRLNMTVDGSGTVKGIITGVNWKLR